MPKASALTTEQKAKNLVKQVTGVVMDAGIPETAEEEGMALLQAATAFFQAVRKNGNGVK